MVHRFQFRCVKAIQHITRGIWPDRGHCRRACSTYGRQQQRNQIRRALKEAIEPVVRFQTPPPGIAGLPPPPNNSTVRQCWINRHPWFHGFTPSTCVGRTISATSSPPPAGTAPTTSSLRVRSPLQALCQLLPLRLQLLQPGQVSPQRPQTKTAPDKQPEPWDRCWDHIRQPQDLQPWLTAVPPPAASVLLHGLDLVGPTRGHRRRRRRRGGWALPGSERDGRGAGEKVGGAAKDS